MTYGRGGGQPPREEQSYPQQGYGQQYPQGQPWQSQQYDPYAHQRRLQGPSQGARWQPMNYVPQDYPPQGYPPRDAWQQHGQPAQEYAPWQPQEGFSQPPWPEQPGPQPRRSRHRRSWPARHKVLTGLIAIGAVIVIGSIASAASGPPSKATAHTSALTTRPIHAAAPSAAAAPDCSAQAKSWASNAGSQMTAIVTDLSTLGNATTALADDMGGGAEPAGDVSAVQTAAASLQSDAQALEADPAPACVPGLRVDLNTALSDYSKAAIDVTNGLNQLSAGNDAVAVADMNTASTVENEGTAKLGTATSAVKAFSASQGD